MRAQRAGKVGVIAVDGTKLQANASRNENRDYEQLAREILEEAKARRRGRGRALRRGARRRTAAGVRDRAGSARVAARGQAAPRGRARRRSRSRCRAAARSALQGGQAPPGRGALDRGARQPGLRGLPRARADEGRAALRPRRRTPTSRRTTPEGRVNVTDPDSTVVKGLRGWMQGYNAQAVVNEHQIVLAAEVETVGADFGHLEPMLDAAQRELAAAGVTEHARGAARRRRLLARRADGDASSTAASQVLIPPDTSRRKRTRPRLGRRPLRRSCAECSPPSAAASSTAKRQADDRAGLRADEVQPRPRSLPTTRPRRRPHRNGGCITATHNLRG